MGGWLRNRFGRTVAVGTLAVAGVGGLAYAVAGPLTSSTVASTNFQASGTKGAPPCAASPGTVRGGVAGSSGAAGSGAASAANACGAIGGRRGVIRRLLARSAHASLTVRDRSGQWVTVDFDRGTVTTISSTSISIMRPDGVSVTAPLNSSTKFLRQPESAVVAGDRVVVVQEGGVARYVLVGKPAGAKRGGAGAGKKAGKGAAALTISVA